MYGDDRLRTLTLVNATTSFALGLLNTLWALYLLRALAMSATAFGVVLGLGALGAAAGALAAPALARRYGPGPMMMAALAITPLTQLALLLASPGLRWQIAIGAALFLQLACAGAAGTTQRSIRQIITIAGMQARMQAVSTWLTSGARPVAALLAGGLGTSIGVRATLTAGTCLLLVPLVTLACSPLRALRQMPDPPPRPTRHSRRPRAVSTRAPALRSDRARARTYGSRLARPLIGRRYHVSKVPNAAAAPLASVAAAPLNPLECTVLSDPAVPAPPLMPPKSAGWCGWPAAVRRSASAWIASGAVSSKSTQVSRAVSGAAGVPACGLNRLVRTRRLR
ncbi:MFS transporter [Streptomyces lydicus]|uniref:MFS transporter n=1 Tax=Streptomyces lydicus TaxID=47763 RepID=UPI0036FB68A2